MHLRRIHLRNIRSIEELVWELPDEAHGPGWHVILGDNGSGKSTVLRAIALALIGPKEAPALRQSWKGWLRRGTSEASVDLDLHPTAGTPTGQGRPVGIRLALPEHPTGEAEAVEISFSHLSEEYSRTRNSGNVWSTSVIGGWFSASYGPFRRFAGGDPVQEELANSNPKLVRHLSLFGEAVALTEGPRWLQSLRFKQLEAPESAESVLLEGIKTLINQPGFLPHGVSLQEISSTGVTFLDGSGVEVPIQDLSDGYRSVLSMTLELIRQMALWMPSAHMHLFSADGGVVQASATVLIDEVDAHLHPTWQRTIGQWLLRYFPNVQFLVTTHSPLICQAAEAGSVFLLPRPGSGESGEMLRGDRLQRLLYGNVLDAYSTGAFGEGVTRSDAALDKLERLAALNAAELQGQLSKQEQDEQDELRRIMPTAASVA